MKKNLIVALALVFVLGIAGTAFAAANPFVDVPAKHWAYDAVSKLAQAGILDGYGDGTYRGERLATRYEMAQATAKAMARSDKANAQLKALIDKLAVEFAAELNNLGVRVAKLEKYASTIKFTGNSRLRFQKTDNDTGIWAHRIQLNLVADPAENVSFLGRIDAQNQFNGNNNVNGTAAANRGITDQLEFAVAQFTYKNFMTNTNFSAGRMVGSFGVGDVYSWGFWDGAKLVGTVGKVEWMVGYGDARFAPGPYMAEANNSGATAASVANQIAEPWTFWALGFKAPLSKEFTFAGGYVKRDENVPAASRVGEWNLGLNWLKADWNAWVSYSKNSEAVANQNSDMIIARLQYKDAVASKQGSYALYAGYMKVGTLPAKTKIGGAYFSYPDETSGFQVGVKYVPAKNVIMGFEVLSLRDYVGNALLNGADTRIQFRTDFIF